MAVTTTLSFLLSSIAAVMVFAGMQMYKQFLASTQPLTIVGGAIGALLFVFLLTAVNNLENVLLGRGFQAKLFPEATFCIVAAMFASGLVHRVCITTCLIFSCVALFYLNKLAQAKYAPAETATVIASKSKKRK